MIDFIVGRRADLRDALYEQLLQYRHTIFVRRLGWDLPGCDSNRTREADQFDTPDTVYVTALRAGQVCACARLLPTTRPYLLEQVFPELLASAPVPRAASVWELSRFAADGACSSASRADSDLARAIFQLALFTGHMLGADRLIGVASLNVERFCARHGLQLLPLGARTRCAGEEAGAFAIHIDPACAAETRALLGAHRVRWQLAPEAAPPEARIAERAQSTFHLPCSAVNQPSKEMRKWPNTSTQPMPHCSSL